MEDEILNARYEYKTEKFQQPPTSEDIERFASDGWRLVSVTADLLASSTSQLQYVTYWERVLSPEAIVPANSELTTSEEGTYLSLASL